MKKWKRFLTVIACIVFLWGVIAVVPRTNNPKGDNIFITDNHRPILIAHGGGNQEFPDNTLEAFCNAYSVDDKVMMETDVSITKDGVVILTHDTSIDRKTNESGLVAEWNYADLIAQRVDFAYDNPTTACEDGSRAFDTTKTRVQYKNYLGEAVLPTQVTYPQTYYDGVSQGKVTERDTEKFLATTLEELLIVFPDNAISVEIKQSGDVGLDALDAVMQLVEQYDAFDRVVFASFHAEIYKQIKLNYKQNNDIMFSPEEIGVAGILISGWLMWDLFYFEPISVLQVPPEKLGFSLDTEHFVRTAHRHNIAVHYWTIDDEETMRYLISIGADGIMTNRPHLLKEVLDSMV